MCVLNYRIGFDPYMRKIHIYLLKPLIISFKKFTYQNLLWVKIKYVELVLTPMVHQYKKMGRVENLLTIHGCSTIFIPKLR